MNMQIFPPLNCDIYDGNVEQCSSLAESVATAQQMFPSHLIGVKLVIFLRPIKMQYHSLINEDELIEESRDICR